MTKRTLRRHACCDRLDRCFQYVRPHQHLPRFTGRRSDASLAAVPSLAAREHHHVALRQIAARSSRPATEASQQELWAPGDAYAAGAERLRAFVSGLPELSEEALGGLLAANPGLVERGPQEVKAALEALSAALSEADAAAEGAAAAGSVDLPRAARLAGKVAAVWDRPAGEVAGRVRALAAELGVGVGAALDLVCAQPGIWQVSQPSIIRDRLDTLATRMGVPLVSLVAMVGRQALLWVVPPTQIAITVRQLAESLGLSYDDAVELVVRLPPVLALEPRLLALSVQGLSSSAGVPLPALLALLCRCPGMAALPCELLGASVEGLATDLGVGPEHVVALLTAQPTLLCAQYGTITGALDMLEAGLQVSRGEALAVLASQPGLMYETTLDTIVSRLDGLASTFALAPAEARQLAASQPALLAVAPASVRSSTSVLGSRMGASLAECLSLARSDPGAFLLASYQDSMLDAWAARLGLDRDDVAALLSAQPALLELTANTVKARLESLAALFGVPLGLAYQLVLKHAALAAVPPNATITRAKNLTMSLRLNSMSSGSGIIAKEPALLAVAATHGSDLRPRLDAALEIGAVYEYYTMEWLQRQLKEMQPARVTSFAGLDG